MSPRVRVIDPLPNHPHTHTIIFLHGRGSNCDEFINEFLEAKISTIEYDSPKLIDLFPTIRWVIPSAPAMYASRFECMESQWFDMWTIEEPNRMAEIQVEGLTKSIKMIQKIIQKEKKHVSHNKIFLGGISQGFAAAYSAYFLAEERFAGLIGLSTWVPLTAIGKMKWKMDDITNVMDQQERSTPVFIAHSRDDPLVPVKEGQELRDILLGRTKARVEYHEYDRGGHWINEPQGVNDLIAFIERATKP